MKAKGNGKINTLKRQMSLVEQLNNLLTVFSFILIFPFKSVFSMGTSDN